MKDTDVKRGRYGSFVLDIRMYLHSPYADFHTPYADFHSQSLKFNYLILYSSRPYTIFVTPSYYIVFARTEQTPFANQANTVRQRS